MAKTTLKIRKEPGKKTSGRTVNPTKIEKGSTETLGKIQGKKEVAKTAGWNHLHTIAFWGLAALLFLPPYFRGLFFAPEQEKALIFAAVVLWVAWLWKWLNRDYGFLSHPLDYFVLAFPAVYLISSFQAANHGLALDEVIKTTLYFMVYWLTSRLVRSEKEASTVLLVIYLSALGVALAGLASATGLIQIKDGFLNKRIYSTFQYPNALASYLAAAIFTGLYLWKEAGTPISRRVSSLMKGILDRLFPVELKPYFFAAGNYLLFAVFLGTKSNGGLLVFSFVLILYLLSLPKGNRMPLLFHAVFSGTPAFIAIRGFLSCTTGGFPGMAWLWVAAGLVLAVLGQFLYSELEKRGLFLWVATHRKAVLTGALLVVLTASIGMGIFAGSQGETTKALAEKMRLRNATERFCFYQDAFNMFKERPVLGWGGGGWEEAYRAHQSFLYNSNQVHGYYFQIMVETGVLGLTVIFGIWFCFLLLTHKLYHGAREDSGARPLLAAITAAAIAIGLHAAIDFNLSLSALALVLWAFFGLAGGIGGYTGLKTEVKKGRSGAAAGYGPMLALSAGLIVVVVFSGTLAAGNSYSKQAGTAFQKQDYNKGLALLQKASSTNPFNAGYHSNLASIYSRAGALDQAALEAREAVRMSRYNSQRYADLASIQLSLKNYDAVLEYSEKALALSPFQIKWYGTVARSYFIVGYNEFINGARNEARNHLEAAAGVPARIEAQMSKVGETQRKLWNVAPLMSAEADMNVNLSAGSAQYLLGRLAEAGPLLQIALQDEKTKGEAAFWLALTREKQGQEQEAGEYLSLAQNLVPELAKGYEGLKALPALE
ncbi:MAG: O-Antigen ligase [Firmicutes bacterium ADurb.Bin456]|nr:MAG: O-Antigen ligase [Firmicutes bacterium ADurb.Bin456]